MDFDQPITQDFDAEDVDIFELGTSVTNQSVASNPLQNILLEDEGGSLGRSSTRGRIATGACIQFNNK